MQSSVRAGLLGPSALVRMVVPETMASQHFAQPRSNHSVGPTLNSGRGSHWGDWCPPQGKDANVEAAAVSELALATAEAKDQTGLWLDPAGLA